jgi:hypothetical protein
MCRSLQIACAGGTETRGLQDSDVIVIVDIVLVYMSEWSGDYESFMSKKFMSAFKQAPILILFISLARLHPIRARASYRPVGLALV